MDLLHGEDKKKCIEELRQYNPRLTFPTIVIGGEKILVGYHPDEFEEAFADVKQDA